MKFLDLIKIITEQEAVASPSQPQEQQIPPQPALVPKEPEKVLTSGYEKARQITIDCLTILKNAIDLGTNMEGIITPELEDAVKSLEIPDVVSNEKIASTIEQIHDGIAKNIKDESPIES